MNKKEDSIRNMREIINEEKREYEASEEILALLEEYILIKEKYKILCDQIVQRTEEAIKLNG